MLIIIGSMSVPVFALDPISDEDANHFENSYCVHKGYKDSLAGYQICQIFNLKDLWNSVIKLQEDLTSTINFVAHESYKVTDHETRITNLENSTSNVSVSQNSSVIMYADNLLITCPDSTIIDNGIVNFFSPYNENAELVRDDSHGALQTSTPQGNRTIFYFEDGNVGQSTFSVFVESVEYEYQRICGLTEPSGFNFSGLCNVNGTSSNVIFDVEVLGSNMTVNFVPNVSELYSVCGT